MIDVAGGLDEMEKKSPAIYTRRQKLKLDSNQKAIFGSGLSKNRFSYKRPTLHLLSP